ncbi:hypothetical protein FE257_005741 [Aspergillus nanangensis]|uniref:L-tryptophan decarboxylase PsiD-like domain-containing protein n=1 Tax=Aspergillus nanangensis TaxID=2582783 RepID=A0AAD4CQ20_ASPNN|nr:hypothetical protein FE257_005741 [Aspergillus nanangensis]
MTLKQRLYSNSPVPRKDWLGHVLDSIHEQGSVDGEISLDPVVQEFKDLIEGDSTLRMLAGSMFHEVPYHDDPVGNPQVREPDTMFKMINHLLTEAPRWSDQAYDAGHVGLPLNTIFNWPMATPSGHAFFLHPKVNVQLKKILKKWEQYLSTPDSLNVVSKSDWLSPSARRSLAEDANLVPGKSYTFEEIYICDPTKPHHGWKSWDDFFVREFRPSVRPVHFPDPPIATRWSSSTGRGPRDQDPTAVIVSPCEAKPFALRTRVNECDSFWLKGQPYSVREMLSPSPLESMSDHFTGGTIYQAFLGPTTYHRWHAPVSGIIRGHATIDGTYFSAPPLTGFPGPEGPDPTAQDRAQGYLPHVATRAIMIIEADNPDIGLVCFIAVGMVEISSCEIDPQIVSGDKVRVQKGEPTGMFHYGGSTYCLIFQKEARLNWVGECIPHVHEFHKNVAVNSALAFAQPREKKRLEACVDCS